MLPFDIPIIVNMMCQNFFWQTPFCNTAAALSSLESCIVVSLRYLTLTYWPWTSPDLPIQVVTSDKCLNNSVFSCLQRTAHDRHTLVFFNFAFCSNIKSSPVITDHFTCCYVIWTDILRNEIILLLKKVNKGLLKFGLA